MGQPSTQASNAVMYLTYGAFLFVILRDSALSSFAYTDTKLTMDAALLEQALPGE
jgi:hypothetical protein